MFSAAVLAAGLLLSGTPDVTVLFFTASWCGPCRAVHAVLDKAAREYGDRIKVIEVDFDSATEENERWDVRDIPVAIVIGGEGKVAMRAHGASRETLRALRSGLDSLLKSSRKGGNR